ncbi:MAG: HDIG domain-containing protein [Treponema sp.]|nr:HDIG domain-containing protein [Treponema sp.]
MPKQIISNLYRKTLGIIRRYLPDYLPRLGRISGIVCLCSFAATVVITVSHINMNMEGLGDLSDFEIGRVAERDIIAEHSFSYIDENATRLRMEAQEHLVPAVFRYFETVADESLQAWNAFCDYADSLIEEGLSQSSVLLALQAEYPARFPTGIIAAYLSAPDRAVFREYGLEVLSALYAKGVYTMELTDSTLYNPDMVELLFTRSGRTERERVIRSTITMLTNAEDSITQFSEPLPSGFRDLAAGLLRPFVRENVLFSPEDYQMRVTEAMERVSDVVIYIERDKPIIRKGFIITAQEMLDLEAYYSTIPAMNPSNIIGLVLLFALLYSLFIVLQDKLIQHRKLTVSEKNLFFILIFLYIAGAAFAKGLVPILSPFPVSLFFPTALMVMIPAVFMGPLFALAMAMAFPLSACLAGFFDIPSLLFALTSGLAASVVLRKAEKRMDIIKAGLIIAAVNCVAVIVVQLMWTTHFFGSHIMLLGAALNGIVSGMLFLGVLAPLEHALNTATTFRLIELSDLNAPILRKLFTAAPGTYSHSVMVATLAEQACQDIGANALLARVGAYYHDIGKMDNPNYFAENQTNYNRHDDIAPRLSATVIRSHLKIGVEKARSLGLPEDVINIIAEHHGNSLITWFYNKAAKQEEQVNSEDFSYPGNPPRSRESAIVMLADITEAALRTLKKPTVARMEKFIQQLFDSKVEHGQLALSDLSFRDLEIIKKAFIKVLAGYYHSRIEYPKTTSESKATSESKEGNG